jgi:hypothetical protein
MGRRRGVAWWIASVGPGHVSPSRGLIMAWRARGRNFSTPDASPSGGGSSTPLSGKRYTFKGHLTSAEAVDDPRGFTVLEGALGRRETKIMSKGYENLRTKLAEEGILLLYNDKQLRLTKNYVFDSPSSAASVLSGGSKNGRVEWRDASGLTLKQNQEAAAS